MNVFDRISHWFITSVLRVPEAPLRPPSQRPSLSEDDVIAIMRQAGNHALADEMQRGMDRRKREDAALHAHELTADDAAMIRALGGAMFGPNSSVTLPSGRTVSGAEMRKWTDDAQH